MPALAVPLLAIGAIGQAASTAVQIKGANDAADAADEQMARQDAKQKSLERQAGIADRKKKSDEAQVSANAARVSAARASMPGFSGAPGSGSIMTGGSLGYSGTPAGAGGGKTILGY